MTTRTAQRRIVFDTATGRFGEVMDEIRARPDGPITSVWLRPVGGGYEWRAEPGRVQPYTPQGKS